MNEGLAAEAPDLTGDGVELVAAPGRQRHIRSLSRERERDGAADAASAARDQRLLAFEREHREPSLRLENPPIVGTSRRLA